MRRSLGVLAVAGLVVTLALVWWTRAGGAPAEVPARPEPLPAQAESSHSGSASPEAVVLTPTVSTPAGGRLLYDPVVVGPCNLTPSEEQEVSSQVDGMLEGVAVSLGDPVEAGAVLGRLDDRLLRPQLELLQIKAASESARLIAEAQRNEIDERLTVAKRLVRTDSVPQVEYNAYLHQRQRYAEEVKKAREDQHVARKELERAQRLLDLYAIRSGIAGEVTRVYKRDGEAVRQGEPLFRVADFGRLQIEGFCKVQQAGLLRAGMRAVVEPEVRGEQLTELGGHTGTVTGVAVSPDGRLVASASEDRTVLLWHWPEGTRCGVLRHPAEVLAVAFAPAGGRTRLLTGCADGRARLWTATAGGQLEGPTVLADCHDGGIRAVAFSPDGRRCATGGDDKRVGLWDCDSGRRLCWVRPRGDELETAHQGAVTALAFTADGHLLSAGRDNSLRAWRLADAGADLAATLPGRTGEVTQPGLGPDGRRVLFDHGEELRVLDWRDGQTLGSLRSRRQGRFHAFALFSPDGRLVLTASTNGRIQLWTVPASPAEARFFRQGYRHGLRRDSLLALGALAEVLTPAPAAPTSALLSAGSWPEGRAGEHGSLIPRLWDLDGHELRHFLRPTAAAPTCAAFSPGGEVVFTGGADKVVRVWEVPAGAARRQPVEAEITYVGRQVERGTDMIRVRARLENPRDPAARLRPGTYVHLRLYPETGEGG